MSILTYLFRPSRYEFCAHTCRHASFVDEVWMCLKGYSTVHCGYYLQHTFIQRLIIVLLGFNK